MLPFRHYGRSITIQYSRGKQDQLIVFFLLFVTAPLWANVSCEVGNHNSSFFLLLGARWSILFSRGPLLYRCDICVNGFPELKNLEEEAKAFMQVLLAQSGIISHGTSFRSSEQPSFRMVISGIRKKFEKFASSDQRWWQGLARILKDKGYIKEANNKVRIAVTYPELTELGINFLQSSGHQTLFAYPQADMLISRAEERTYSTSSEWGRGWADPEIRRQRLQRIRNSTRRKRPRRNKADPSTARGRISTKLAKHNR